jgi:CelD/BcsL family acetyltransferase involved in cellulose biosynthesis
VRPRSLQAAFAEGAAAYRFLRGDESYKRRFGTVDDPLVTFASGATPLGNMAVAVAHGLRRSGMLRELVRLRI